MNGTTAENNKLSSQRIELQNSFKDYTAKNGFSYEEWINPPAGSFYESYKKDLDAINEQIAPELQYQ